MNADQAAWEDYFIKRANYLNRTLLNDAKYLTQVFVQGAVQDVLLQAAAQAEGETKASLEAFSNSLKSNAGVNRKGRLNRVFSEVADNAQQATIKKYEQQHGGKPSYRSGDPDGEPSYRRYSGGVLRRALDSDYLFRASADGVSLNTGVLDDKAKQWARLNFGAYGTTQKAFKNKAIANPTMTFLGQRVEGLSLADRQPGSAFEVLPGFFSDSAFPTTAGRKMKTTPAGAGRGQAFYPISGALTPHPRSTNGGKPFRGRRVATGIAAGRFLDAGVTVLNRQIPVAMAQVFLEWSEEAAGASRNKSGSPRTSGPSGPLASQFTTRQASRVASRLQKNLATHEAIKKDLAKQLARNRRIFPA